MQRPASCLPELRLLLVGKEVEVGVVACQIKRITWVVVKIVVPFWIPIVIRHLIFGVSKKDQNFDNHPHVLSMASSNSAG